MQCYRCSKELISPDENTANYVIASDSIIDEKREVLYALRDEEDKDDNALEHIKVNNIADAYRIRRDDKLVRIRKIVEKQEIEHIQKTAIICDDCLKDDDLIIWGKGRERKNGMV